MKIGGFFGRNAWGPLWEHLAKCRDCLESLKTIIDYFFEEKYSRLDELAEKTAKLESDADSIKENIRQRLSRSVFSSVERSDIIAWLRQQDGIADSCEDLAKLLSLRKTKLVKELKQPMDNMLKQILFMMNELIEAVKIFCDMSIKETGQEEQDKLLNYVDNTQKGKSELDKLQMDFLKTLFSAESRLDPVSVFFLKDAGEKLARIGDRIENVGDIVRHMVQR